jgi:hypothetical protein
VRSVNFTFPIERTVQLMTIQPYRPHMITNASFMSSVSSYPSASPKPMRDELPSEPTSLYLFPSFEYVTMPATSDTAGYSLSLDTLIRGLGDMNAGNGRVGGNQASLQDMNSHQEDRAALTSIPVHEVVVLICGHGGRDNRCGALGLPLQNEFEQKLRNASIGTLPRQRGLHANAASTDAHVGLISHIGGHKWAGNVIIYIPPSWRIGGLHSLSGSAIWYGRVEPKHVEGIVQETIVGGRIIRDLWRGGMKLSSSDGNSRWEAITEDAS